MTIPQAAIDAACEAYRHPKRMITNTSDGAHHDRMSAALEAAMPELLDQIEQLQAVVRDSHDNCTYQTRIAAVEKLHEGVPSSDPVADGLCNECYVPSPCPTIKAVHGE